ncbi:outer membrane protein assembly factor BamE [Methylobrevis albus]|uniref:Outer membrane protein assembly factor BamE n=1 Tax=Methylobrevis albus TaxID=2793297 RepID=A0A931I4G4_9HYPH|nr:outer membrane protein assembly factor BamE [Methylobrevis albus]MBH0239727.1 outer membrane protein assembly factor BamE [Methylobrevis albus]
MNKRFSEPLDIAPRRARPGTASRRAVVLAGLALAATLAACSRPPVQHGWVMPLDAIEQVPIGSSQEQVLLVLGTPSTTSALDGTAYYYISQAISEGAFTGRRITDQRVLAVYFDANNTVREIGNYGLQDGKVFDFISRRTRTTGRDVTFIGQLLGANLAPGF